MWIIIAGLALTSPLILYYLANDSSIIIDKKNSKIIIPEDSPPIVIKFTDLMKVELIESDATPIVEEAKAKQKSTRKPELVCLKITVANIDNPLYIKFINNPNNSFNYRNSSKKAQALFNKLSEVITLTGKPQTNATGVKNYAEFQLKKLSEFKTNIMRSAS